MKYSQYISRKYQFIVLSAVSLALTFASQAVAGAGYKIINTEQLKIMINEKTAFILVDARTKEEEDGH
jgi:hypothetical protein